MKVERTFNQAFIIKCVTHPDVWEMSNDDTACNPDLFFPVMDERIIWLRAGDYGVFMAHAHNLVTFECHTMFMPKGRGKVIEAGRQAVKWMFENTTCERIVTNVPEFNKVALKVAERSGFIQYGINPGSFKKNGNLYAQILLGISKEGG